MRTDGPATLAADTDAAAERVLIDLYRKMTPAQKLHAIFELQRTADAIAVPYAVGGSVASGLHGEPRMTQDVDILVDLPPQRVEPLVRALRPEFYVDLEAARSAVRSKSSFNAIHLGFHHKVDLFVASDDLLDREQLARRIPVTLSADESRPIFVTAAENIFLRKLDWFRKGNEISDVQWRDVLGLLKIGRGVLDLDYVRRIADTTGLADLLDRALAQAGY